MNFHPDQVRFLIVEAENPYDHFLRAYQINSFHLIQKYDQRRFRKMPLGKVQFLPLATAKSILEWCNTLSLECQKNFNSKATHQKVISRVVRVALYVNTFNSITEDENQMSESTLKAWVKNGGTNEQLQYLMRCIAWCFGFELEGERQKYNRVTFDLRDLELCPHLRELKVS